MMAALIGREHKATGFDGARTHQGMPVRRTRRLRECRRNSNQFCTGLRQCSIERPETQIVTDLQAELPPFSGDHHGRVTRCNRF